MIHPPSNLSVTSTVVPSSSQPSLFSLMIALTLLVLASQASAQGLIDPQLHLDTQIESPAQNNSVLIFTDKRPGDTLQIQLFVPDVASQDIQAFTLELTLQGKTFANFISSISGSDWMGEALFSGLSVSDNPTLSGLFPNAATVPMTGYLGQIDLEVIGVLSDEDTLRVTSAFLAVAGGTLQSVDVSNAALSFEPICPGDFDDNGMVNMADFVLFGIVFGTRSSDAGYNALMDMDSNGTIDAADFLLFVNVFGTTCEQQQQPPSVGNGGRPDLIVESPSVSDSTLTAGQAFTLQATVRNLGSGQSPATTLHYYQSVDATISSSDRQVGSASVGILTASGSSITSLSLNAPSSVGTYYYGACVASVSDESNANNNCSRAVQVTISSDPVSGDRAALVALYNATDGPNWVFNTNWLSDRPLGEWYGVTTDDAGRVTRLQLYTKNGNEPFGNSGSTTSNGLSGSIPAELGNLTNLQVLDLVANELSGSIPAKLGNLTNLRGLGLAGNALSGSIPAELGNLTNLTQLILQFNALSGSIPAELGSLSNLTQLILNHNELTGNIPAELGNLTNLQYLWLHNNAGLSGPLPDSFTGLGDLEDLRMDGTELCAPTDAAFQTWLQGIENKRGVTNCEPGPFHSTFEQPTRSEIVVIDGIEREAAENEILVFLEEDISLPEVIICEAQIQAQGGSVKSLNFDLRTIQCGIGNDIVEQDFINVLSQQPGVTGANVNEVVVPDQSFITSNDAGYRQRRTKLVDTQPLLVPPPSPVSFAGDFWINQIDAVNAWNALSDPGVMLVPNAIGIVDTGVPSPYDVLNSSRINRYSEDGVSLSGDDTSNPHGYNVTGYAAGYGNGPDRRGVNPHSDVVFVDVLDPTGKVYNTTLMLGIKTAIDKGAGVVNISWRPGVLHRNQMPSVRQDVMQRWRRSCNGVVHYARKRDVLLVWAAGSEWEKQYDRLLSLRNGRVDVANTDSWLSHSLIVGASTESQMDACFSLMGEAVDIMAPGQDVGFGTGTGNGTSYAAPMVTGAAGLVRAIESTISAEETRSILINSAKNTITFNTTCGEPVASSPAGLLNLGSAIQSSLVADGVGLNIAGDVHLARGQMANVLINVTVPSGGVNAIDVGFVIDQSGSYDDDIQTLQNRATEIVNSFKARTDVDVQFGVAGFADFPQPPYGGPEDVSYRLYQSITDDQNALIAAIDKLDKPLMWGDDIPESQYEALFRTAREIGWRDGALRILLLATDADFHDSDTESGYPGTGRMAALATLKTENVIVIGLQSGDDSAAAQRLQELADATGGSVLSLDAASSQIVDAIVRGVDAALAEVDVTLDILAGQSWVTDITPTVHQDVRPGATVSFTVSLQGQRDPSIEDLPYNVYLWARGDGSALLSRTKIPIIVPKQ